MNVLLRSLARTGAGYTHSSGVHCNFLAFADDIVLITDDAKKMQTLVAEVELFASWSKMWVNQSKCRICAMDYGRNKPLETDMIHYGGNPFPPMDSKESYKYLGYHINLSLNWTHHKSVVLAKMEAAVDCLRDAVYLPHQLEEMVRVCVVPLFRYSASLVPWTPGELAAISTKLAGAIKVA